MAAAETRGEARRKEEARKSAEAARRAAEEQEEAASVAKGDRRLAEAEELLATVEGHERDGGVGEGGERGAESLAEARRALAAAKVAYGSVKGAWVVPLRDERMAAAERLGKKVRVCVFSE